MEIKIADTELNEIVHASNQSFTAILKLKKTISKIESANWFYQQRNVPNPFDFEYSESTILGYNIIITKPITCMTINCIIPK